MDVQESDNRYFLTLAKFNQRQIELIDNVSARFFVQNIKIDKEKIFLSVDNHRSTKLSKSKRNQAYIIQFNQETLLVEKIIGKIELCKQSYNNIQLTFKGKVAGFEKQNTFN